MRVSWIMGHSTGKLKATADRPSGYVLIDHKSGREIFPTIIGKINYNIWVHNWIVSLIRYE